VRFEVLTVVLLKI